MKNTLLLQLALLLTGSLLLCACADSAPNGSTLNKDPRILVFSKTAGFRHTSIGAGIAAIRKLGQENGVQVTATEDAAYFQADSLKKYKAVVFLSTTNDVLNNEQQSAFENYIRAGGGFAGIHAASDTEFDWPWYGKLVGAYFANHPKIQQASIVVVDKKHLATSFLPDRWGRTDEWYNFKNINPDMHVLATLDESTYSGGTNGDNHPIAWYHEFDGGRAFYTALGHTEESYSEPLFLKHLWGGIAYAMGRKR
ncbi:ThuA domain-containing protein [Botryobacter ruber]|uniref:ThuA domain-containing protein n=1 Tax=Botryobacter ruber TaxID=2171629 RepID=UPI000E0B8418|nr:ThuA domain-containing protein [Botryobacter ruber]